MKISTFVIAFAIIMVTISSIGLLIGINDYDKIDYYDSEFRVLFVGVNESEIINNYENVSKIDAESGEDGTFQSYKIGSKLDTKVGFNYNQVKAIAQNYSNYLGINIIYTLIIIIVGTSLLFAGIATILGRNA